MIPWLSVIGIGEDGLAGLSPSARALVETAEVLVGGRRHLAMVPEGGAERLAWGHPFARTREALEALRGRRVAVLASGDPLWFGAASTLLKWFDADEIEVVPHVGAFSLAAARLKWPLHDALCLTVHGRPLEALALHFQPGRRLLALSNDAGTPARIAALLKEQGFGPSRLVVLENLGGADERILDDWRHCSADLNVVAVEVAAAPGVRALPLIPGLPDDSFEHDGQLTKREVRAATLALLGPLGGELLWDVGAGCGSIAIEWMRAGGSAVAVEPAPERAARIARNALALGVPGLEIVQGRAPEALPEGGPDAVFVGGGVSAEGVLDSCWAALKPGGRLVANAVTAEGEAALFAFRARRGGEMTRLSVSRLATTGSFSTWHPAMPVTQYLGWKR